MIFPLKRGVDRPPPATGGEIIYAIGDIHGRDDLLVEILRRITRPDGEDMTLIFLGDVIDRGPASAQVLRRIRTLCLQRPGRVHMLLGNHEDTMLAFVQDPLNSPRWIEFNGSAATCRSFHVEPLKEFVANELLRVAADMRRALGPIENFLRKRPLTLHRDGLFFSHAGIDATRPLEAQERHTLLWGDERFYRHGHSHPEWVIHGHMIVEKPVMEKGRIGIDTGAYMSGRLTALRIGPDGPGLVSVRE